MGFLKTVMGDFMVANYKGVFASYLIFISVKALY